MTFSVCTQPWAVCSFVESPVSVNQSTEGSVKGCITSESVDALFTPVHTVEGDLLSSVCWKAMRYLQAECHI